VFLTSQSCLNAVSKVCQCTVTYRVSCALNIIVFKFILVSHLAKHHVTSSLVVIWYKTRLIGVLFVLSTLRNAGSHDLRVTLDDVLDCRFTRVRVASYAG
jgi:hypothetical protein